MTIDKIGLDRRFNGKKQTTTTTTKTELRKARLIGTWGSTG
jgi:hypothetical protein